MKVLTGKSSETYSARMTGDGSVLWNWTGLIRLCESEFLRVDTERAGGGNVPTFCGSGQMCSLQMCSVLEYYPYVLLRDYAQDCCSAVNLAAWSNKKHEGSALTHTSKTEDEPPGDDQESPQYHNYWVSAVTWNPSVMLLWLARLLRVPH